MTKFSTERLASLDAPVLTGDARAVTTAASDSDTSVATTAFVQAAIAAAIGGAGASTGDAKITLKTVADPGWVIMNDGTIGDATSGATTRANADTQALFILMWTNMVDAWCPVSGGRGASALADFNAHKTLLMPYQLGRAIAIAGAGSGLSSRTLGSIAGTETNTQTAGTLYPHNHGLITYGGAAGIGAISGVEPWGHDGSYNAVGTYNGMGTTGSGSPANNIQPSTFWNMMIKL